MREEPPDERQLFGGLLVFGKANLPFSRAKSDNILVITSTMRPLLTFQRWKPASVAEGFGPSARQWSRKMYRLSAHFSFPTIAEMVKGVLAAAANFVVLGTLTALWENPFLIRMMPAGNWEIFTLLAISSLLGLFIVIRRPSCSVRSAEAGGILGFLGIVCPICNKLLLLLFGGEFLLTYFEPLRPYVALAGGGIVSSRDCTRARIAETRLLRLATESGR